MAWVVTSISYAVFAFTAWALVVPLVATASIADWLYKTMGKLDEYYD